MNLTAEELQKKLSELPPAIVEAISSVDFGSKLQDIGETHKLHVDVMDALFAEVGYLMLGLTKPEEFKSKIREVTNTTDEEAQNIVLDINAKILNPIKKELVELHGVSNEKYFAAEATRMNNSEISANTTSKQPPIVENKPDEKPPINVLTYGAVPTSQKPAEQVASSKTSGGAASALASKPYEWDEKKASQNIPQTPPVAQVKNVIDLNTLKTTSVKEPLKNVLPVEEKSPREEVSKPQSELEKILNPVPKVIENEVATPVTPKVDTPTKTSNPNRRLSLAEEAALLKEKGRDLTRALETKTPVASPTPKPAVPEMAQSKLEEKEISTLSANTPEVKIVPEEKIAERAEVRTPSTMSANPEKQTLPQDKLTGVTHQKRVILTLKKPLSELMADATKKAEALKAPAAQPKKQTDPYREPID